jgi:hypothetical protein
MRDGISGNISRRESRTALAVAMPPVGRTSGSASPWITRVGELSRRSPSVRSGLAMMAAVCRLVPLGRKARARLRSALARWAASSQCGPPINLKVAIDRSTAVSRVGSGMRAIAGSSRGAMPPCLRSPVLDMIEVSDLTRSGWPMARL